MSPCVHPTGRTGAGGLPRVTMTLSNVAVAVTPATWLETASPTRIVAPIGIVSLPTAVHDTPSPDSYPVITSPARTSFTQRGAVDWLPGELTLAPPPTGRRWNGTPLIADAATSMKPCADDEASAPRIITPAFVHAFTFWIVVT